jgi:hypothetical protein
MHETGNLKVAAREGAGDVPHVLANAGDAGRIGLVPLEGDPASLGQALEDMPRGVLIDPHRHVAARLKLGEGAILGVPTSEAPEHEGRRSEDRKRAHGVQLE